MAYIVPQRVDISAGVASSPGEPVIRYDYDHKSGKWSQRAMTVSLNPQPFQEGSLRRVFRLKDHSSQVDLIAKRYKDPNTPRRAYFEEVEMQGKAKSFAEAFNGKNPPKRISCILPFVIEFQRRPGLTMSVEPFMNGTFTKQSNNYGWVSPEDRNTPAAFSHFTYHTSGNRLLVCDIQGVGDTYTDAQIHSADRAGRFGPADLGPQGIAQFFRTHRCNALCQFFNLPAPGKRKPQQLPAEIAAVAAIRK
eukprot:TRINITY_DN57222_c0_g1_i1.p1 TRINITY_DN57222_c0_g1~~TRINITY_DN57222_c0_g1_i1.p1  ORF type:complete len:264 (+),score=22.13 TRINITY_DN57222_c0_g1_i1:48-794(+)